MSGLFEVTNAETLRALDRITDSDVSSHGGEILITRRLYSSGRTSVSLNGSPITLAMLKEAAEHLVDVHGQHDHQYLLKPSNQLDVLDGFANLEALRAQYHAVYLELTDAQQQLRELQAGRSLRQQQLELYRFQAEEIDAAQMDAAEYEELKARASVLENLEKLRKEAGSVHAALYEADGSVLERLKMMVGVLSEMSLLDQNLKSISDTMRDATIALEDSSFDLGRYLDRLDLDPNELLEVNERLNVIHRVLNKYGGTVPTALDFRADVGRQIAQFERETTDLSSLTSQIDPLTRELKSLGAELSTKRRAAAKKLAPLIESQLSELGMEKAKFSIDLTALSQTGAEAPGSPSGFDSIEFIAQTNPGQAPQPLRKIASGGELSRIMLALKGVLTRGDRVSVLVFDEIDANVGGRLGSVIGGKLRELARHHQVLCITHLPQIASYADRHLTVRKQTDGSATTTTVRTMQGDEQIEELAEMIGGQHITETTRAQARELLAAATSTLQITPHSAASLAPRSSTPRKPALPPRSPRKRAT